MSRSCSEILDRDARLQAVQTSTPAGESRDWSTLAPLAASKAQPSVANADRKDHLPPTRRRRAVHQTRTRLDTLLPTASCGGGHYVPSARVYWCEFPQYTTTTAR